MAAVVVVDSLAQEISIIADTESAVPRMINLFIARIFNHKAPCAVKRAGIADEIADRPSIRPSIIGAAGAIL